MNLDKLRKSVLAGVTAAGLLAPDAAKSQSEPGLPPAASEQLTVDKELLNQQAWLKALTELQEAEGAVEEIEKITGKMKELIDRLNERLKREPGTRPDPETVRAIERACEKNRLAEEIANAREMVTLLERSKKEKLSPTDTDRLENLRKRGKDLIDRICEYRGS